MFSPRRECSMCTSNASRTRCYYAALLGHSTATPSTHISFSPMFVAHVLVRREARRAASTWCSLKLCTLAVLLERFGTVERHSRRTNRYLLVVNDTPQPRETFVKGPAWRSQVRSFLSSASPSKASPSALSRPDVQVLSVGVLSVYAAVGCFNHSVMYGVDFVPVDGDMEWSARYE